MHEPDQRLRKQRSHPVAPQAHFRACRDVWLQWNRQGNIHVIKLTFDYYEFVLRTEILNRNRLKKDFLETEVWYLLYNIVRAGSKFEHLKKKIGNVHPQNILINESGQIKIISTVSLPGEITNYDYLL